MGTRSAAFTAKIRNLNDYYLRLIHSVVPAPSGTDLANTLKYFQQVLLGVLREIQEHPMEMLKHRNQDAHRLTLFPNLDYAGLHQSISSLVDTFPLIHYGALAFGQSILNTIACLMVFLDRKIIETLPYLVVSIMHYCPESLHQHVVSSLCYHVLPFTVGSLPSGLEEANYVTASVPAVLMTVFQYTDNSAYHCQLMECLMSLKPDIIKDVLCVIAYGTPGVRSPAANMLFYYWPSLNPTLNDRRGIHIKFSDISSVLKAMFEKKALAAKSGSVSQTENSDSGETKNPKGWKPLTCQIEECDNEGSKDACKVCLDHAVSLGVNPDNAPPLYVCGECAEDIRRGNNLVEFNDILMPMHQVSATCENRNCRSNEKSAVATCYSVECASYNSQRPIRYCHQCLNIRHNNRRGIDHTVHSSVDTPWNMEPQMQNFTIEAIISLLKEAEPFSDLSKSKDQERLNRAGLLDDVDQYDGLSVEERRVMSRYGVWLIISLCAPTERTPPEMLGRLIGGLCHWFNATQYLPDDPSGASIEKLKSDYIHNWLHEVCKTHFEVFIKCLLPHPEEFARVGGHWDTLATRTDHIKEGFNRLFCLVPYELITLQVWERVMPNWMEAINNDIPEEEHVDLKITLSKLLDPEMSPLGFDAPQMYQFMSVRFVNTSASVQEQTLSWLQILSSLNILIPMSTVLVMFQSGVSALCRPPQVQRKSSNPNNLQETSVLEPVIEDDSSAALSEDDCRSEHSQENYTDPEINLTCFVLMLDVLYKQMEVQETVKHQGVEGNDSALVVALIRDMISAEFLAPHTCNPEEECTLCVLMTTFYQLHMDILAYLCPRVAIQNNRVADIVPQDLESSQTKVSPEASTQEPASSSTSPKPPSAPSSLNKEGLMSVVVNMPQIVTATVETVGELDMACDMACNMPQEHVVSAVATAVTLTDEDCAHATVNIVKASVVGEDDKPIDLTKEEEEEVGSYWVTSQGKFKFRIEELPPHLQVIFTLFNHLENTEDGDVIYHMCQCLKYLVLHAEAMVTASNHHRGFLIWMQENKTIQILWSMIDAEWSHVSEVCVQLLLHFVTLPCGSDIFWKLCEKQFNGQNWKVRFQAVEKVVVIGRFLGLSAVRQCPGLQAAIAHAFCFLIASLDDINVSVAQRATLYLTTLPDTGLRALCWCLEQQFDSVIMDRPMIIQALHQLSNRLSERRILTWDFFFNRFDALYLEAQIALEKHGDIAFPRDLKNTDMTSDVFERKLSRAKDALTLCQSASQRTLSGSLGTKWPYKRTMSAPCNLLNRVEKQADIGMHCKEDASVVHQLQRAMDLEETDKDTMHLLVFLFMQFLAQSKHVGHVEDKTSCKLMNLVLRHLSVLMGFSPQERTFVISPARVRSSPVFNPFLSNLMSVLDHNFKMGSLLLPTCIPVLQYCPAPHMAVDLRYPTYSLWFLQPHPRKGWLSTVLTFLYKYDYSAHPLSGQALSLIRIVMNTIDNHFHRCKKVEDSGIISANNYSREISQGSIGGEGSSETPPQSPGGRVTLTMQGDQLAQYHSDSKSTFTPVHATQRSSQQSHHKSGKMDSSLSLDSGFNKSFPPLEHFLIAGKHQAKCITGECEEAVEQELEAIPESPKVESPNNDCKDSWCELESFEHMIVGEQATVRIENHPYHYEPKATILQAGVDSAMMIPQKVHAQAVTTVMASQIQAFDESFTIKIHNPELVSAQLQLPITDYSSISNNKQSNSNGHHKAQQQQQQQRAWIIGGDDSEDIGNHENLVHKMEIQQGGSRPQRPIMQRMKSVDIGSIGYGESNERKSLSPNKQCLPTTIQECVVVSSQFSNMDNMDCSDTVNIESEPAVMHCAQLEEMPRVEEIVFAEACIIDEPQICSAQIQEICSATETTTVNPAAVRSIRSPQSPLSMMDLITLGSPVELTSTDGSPNGASPQESLELPTPERLLSVGPEKDCNQVVKADDQSGGSLLERVWQVVGGWANGSKSNSLRDCELDEVVVTGGNNKPAKIKSIQDPSLGNNDAQITSNNSTEDNTDDTTNTSNSGPTDTCPGKFGRRRKAGIPTQADNQYEEDDDDDKKEDFDWDDQGDVSGMQQSDIEVPPPPSIKQSALRVGEDCMAYRCMECGETLEEFSNDDLGMCIIILSTFVYRQPGLAAPLLPRMLKTVARVSGSEIFSWQYESAVHLPGSATSIGRQFLRCVLHQLAPNQIFNQIFQTKIEEGQRLQLFRTLAQALTDFNELNPSAPVQILLENLNARKVLPVEDIPHILGNVASYMECVSQEGGGALNSSLVPLFDTFLRKLILCVTGLQDMNPILRIMVALLRIPGVASNKGVMDPVSKLLSFAIQNSPAQYNYLNDLCYLCNRIFSRERDKLILTRLVVFELVQALKFKTSIPDKNLILLVQMIVQDGGGTLGTNSIVEDLPKDPSEIGSFPNTGASECMRAHVNDALDFIADVHTLTKVKSNCHKNVGLNEDTMGGLVKAGISQYLAMELARRSSQDHRTLGKYLPWLNSPPTAVQQGPKEFIDCVAHIRLLSWLLLGALSHMCLVPGAVSQPVPPESSCHIADHIQVILAGFAEQSKQSVLHMSSLFHAFILCQLWTVYLEQCAGSPGNDSYGSITSILTDFWAKVTPGILQLVSHSKVLGDMVNLHFASLMEALHECQSTVLSKLLPLWAPVLFVHHKQLPSQLSVRLQACQDAAPPSHPEESMKNPMPNNLLRWLHRLQFKMGQIELQSSQAFQIYTV